MVTMIRLLTIFSVPLVWFTGVSLSQEVNQTPSALLGNPEEKIQLSCTHNIPSYDTILWYQRSVGDTALKLIGYVYYKTITVESPYKGIFNMSGDGEKEAHLHLLKLRLAEDDGRYFCAALGQSSYSQAYFGAGTKLTVLDPNISDTAIPPTNVRVLPPSKHECKDAQERKNKKTLVCVATGFYPDHVSVSWSINGQNQTEGVGTDTSAVWNNKTEKYSITSRLRVAAELWYTQDNQFTCTVLFFDGTQNLPITAEINGETAQSNRGMKTENYVKSTQTAKLAYLVFVAKSSLYGVFVVFFIWKLQGASGKQFT